MRIGRRPPTTPNPGSSLPLRAQALVPFALALALVVGLAAIGAALVARSAVDRELRAQAETARHLVSGRLDQIEQRLTAEVAALADGAPARGGRRQLEEQVMEFSRRERLTLAAVAEDGVPAVGDDRLAWTRLPPARAPLERGRCAGRPASADRH